MFSFLSLFLCPNFSLLQSVTPPLFLAFSGVNSLAKCRTANVTFENGIAREKEISVSSWLFLCLLHLVPFAAFAYFFLVSLLVSLSGFFPLSHTPRFLTHKSTLNSFKSHRKLTRCLLALFCLNSRSLSLPALLSSLSLSRSVFFFVSFI